MINRSDSQTNPHITLRCTRNSDAAFLLTAENDPDTWQYSASSEAPYTARQIERFCTVMERSGGRPDATGQLRLIICLDSLPIGMIDLYDHHATDRSAFVAIMLYPASMRGQGYGGIALRSAINYAHSIGIITLLAEIDARNEESRNLFQSCGFRLSHTTQSGSIIYQL